MPDCTLCSTRRRIRPEQHPQEKRAHVGSRVGVGVMVVLRWVGSKSKIRINQIFSTICIEKQGEQQACNGRINAASLSAKFEKNSTAHWRSTRRHLVHSVHLCTNFALHPLHSVLSCDSCKWPKHSCYLSIGMYSGT